MSSETDRALLTKCLSLNYLCKVGLGTSGATSLVRERSNTTKESFLPYFSIVGVLVTSSQNFMTLSLTKGHFNLKIIVYL